MGGERRSNGLGERCFCVIPMERVGVLFELSAYMACERVGGGSSLSYVTRFCTSG